MRAPHVSLIEFETLKKRLLLRFGTDQFVGESDAFRHALERVTSYSAVDAPVVITGETGTGKESVARAIHYLGDRGDRPFIPVNCGAIPDTLFENELFGHERGAYTDAGHAQRGLLVEAHGGTLFLDEVNALSAANQVKLLRVLEDRRVRPLGASRDVPIDVRIVTATNVALRAEMNAGRFRGDLYYRIGLLTIDLPPLRARSGDVLLLADHYLRHFRTVYDRDGLAFSHDAILAIERHSWPGNVRELKNLIEKAVIDTDGEMITSADLQLACAVEGTIAEPTSLREARRACLSEFERKFLENALRVAHGNVSRAARLAQTHRRSFQRLLRQHGIEPAMYA